MVDAHVGRWRAEESVVEAKTLIHEATVIREAMASVSSIGEARRLVDLVARRAIAAAAEWLELNEVER